MAQDVNIQKAGFVEGVEQLYPTAVLETLLKDRTTGRNIIWADDEYEVLGDGYQGSDEITLDKITGTNSGVIKPRVAKEREKQSQRTREHAEVFTPSWLCNQMNNYMDADWFGREEVFTIEGENAWTPVAAKIEFPEGQTWQDYVNLTKLEITCGEAPFYCSRYDTVTGEVLPVKKRIGFLDRKLRVVSENATTYEEWFEWALRALQSSYAYEYQGDNLTIARLNAIQTIDEYKLECWNKRLNDEEAMQVADVISWNLWQMDGLKGTVPSDKPVDQEALDRINSKRYEQTDMLGIFEMEEPEEKAQFCMIYDWRDDRAQEYVSLRSKGK